MSASIAGLQTTRRPASLQTTGRSAPGLLLQRKCACGGTPSGDTKCETCRQKELGIQRLAAGPGGSSVAPQIVNEVLRSPGQPLDASTRAVMEPHFQHDFSKVRIHTDARAHESAQAVNALAYAAGHNIVFREGSYSPSTFAGKKLLAHELAHVVQNGPNANELPAAIASGEASPFEREANAAAESLGGNSNVPLAGPSTGDSLIHRQEDNFSETAEAKRSRFDAQAAADTDASWGQAAVILNGFSDTDIWNILSGLSVDQLQKLRNAAVASMPGWSDRITGAIDNLATNSVPAPAPAPTTPAPAPASSDSPTGPAPTGIPQPANVNDDSATEKAVTDMTDIEKLESAFKRAKINQAFRDKILSLITAKSLVIAILSFMAVFIVSQFTPVGWAANIGIGLTAIFIGGALFSAINHLLAFADARNATTPEQLDQAGDEFAQAVAEVEVDAIILLVTHGLGGAAEGVPPYEGPPPQGFALATAGSGPALAVASDTIPVTVAAGLGIKGAAAATTLQSQGGSGSSSGQASGGAGGGGPAKPSSGPSVVIDPATGVPQQLSGTAEVGPAFKTFEEAFANKGNPDSHIAEVVLHDTDGTEIASWWEVSESLAERDIRGVGRAGDTEQKALVRVNLKPGQNLEIRGHYPSCEGCQGAMQDVATKTGATITYRLNNGSIRQFPEGDF